MTDAAPTLVQMILISVLPALCVTAALKDVTSFTIPNWISIALALAFVPTALALGANPAQVGLNALVGAGALVLAMGMFAAGWIGGGDAKLFAACALWLGLSGAAPFLMVTGLAGGGLALVLLNLRGRWLRPYVSVGPQWVRRLTTPGEPAPYGVAIAVGALAAFPHSLVMRAFAGGL